MVGVSKTSGQVGKISLTPTAFNSSVDGLGGLERGQVVLCTPVKGAHSIRKSAHVRGCGILWFQQVCPEHGQAGSRINIQQKVIISQGWPHAPTSLLTIVAEHGPPAESVAKTTCTSEPSMLY